MAEAFVMWVDNDMLLEIDGLQDSSDDSYLNAATVTATIKDPDDTEITGQTLPISLSYVSGSNGKYQGVFDTLLALTAGDAGTIEVTAVEGTLNAYWVLTYMTRARRS